MKIKREIIRAFVNIILASCIIWMFEIEGFVSFTGQMPMWQMVGLTAIIFWSVSWLYSQLLIVRGMLAEKKIFHRLFGELIDSVLHTYEYDILGVNYYPPSINLGESGVGRIIGTTIGHVFALFVLLPIALVRLAINLAMLALLFTQGWFILLAVANLFGYMTVNVEMMDIGLKMGLALSLIHIPQIVTKTSYSRSLRGSTWRTTTYWKRFIRF